VEQRVHGELGDGHLSDQMDTLLTRHKDFSRIESVLPQNGKASHEEEIAQLVRQSEVLARAKNSLPPDITGPFDESVALLSKHYMRLKEIDSVVPNATAQDMSELIDLLNALCSFVIGHSTKVSLPFSQDAKNAILKQLVRFKQLCEANERMVRSLFCRAKGVGCNDENFDVALEAILEDIRAKEKEKTIMMMHKELADVRAISEKERNVFERHKLKLKKKVKDLREQIIGMQEKMGERELDMIQELESEQKQRRASVAALEQERSVREELIRIIDGQEADMELLNTAVSPDEMKSIGKALGVMQKM
jgi:hypothetical protein